MILIKNSSVSIYERHVQRRLSDGVQLLHAHNQVIGILLRYHEACDMAATKSFMPEDEMVPF